MVGIVSGVRNTIKGAVKAAMDGSTDGIDVVSEGMFKGEVPPKVGHKSIAAMQEILKRKGLFKRPLNGRRMTRDEIKLKTELDLKGIPGPSSERRG